MATCGHSHTDFIIIVDLFGKLVVPVFSKLVVPVFEVNAQDNLIKGE